MFELEPQNESLTKSLLEGVVTGRPSSHLFPTLFHSVVRMLGSHKVSGRKRWIGVSLPLSLISLSTLLVCRAPNLYFAFWWIPSVKIKREKLNLSTEFSTLTGRINTYLLSPKTKCRACVCRETVTFRRNTIFGGILKQRPILAKLNAD
jgi:hypothetical protein